jgi:TetR/AcrR family transcriptional regulator
MTAQPSLRYRGRPAAGGNNCRAQLLDAAQALFAARGFTATTLRDVATGAGVTPALAHYYFVDKAGLFEVVLRERIAPLLDGIQSSIAADATHDPASALSKFVQQLTLLASRHPWLPQLIVRETKLLDPLTLQLGQLVSAGQASGVIRSDLRADWIVLSVLSLSTFPLARDSSSIQALTLHHLAVLRDGLKAAPGVRVVAKGREIAGV